MKICIASSAGGHFIQALKIVDFLKGENFEYFFITHFAEHIDQNISKNKKLYFITDPRRNFLKFFKSLIQSFAVLKKERPDVVISTGAGTAVPICYLAKFLLRSKIIHIDSFSRVYKPALVSKILYPISDLFFVQWGNMKQKYGAKAIYGGSLL